MKGLSVKQAGLMMARAHGWAPKSYRGGKLPSVAFAKEYVAAKKGSSLLKRAAKYQAARRRRRKAS